MALDVYRRKRHFKRTPEPAGKVAKKGAKGRDKKSQPQFVIQEHHARRLHYDFRLELDGVLKSWAIPKGPSLDPGQRRLAVETEDHPLDYANFEGTIPKGEYGAGQVIVWDRGTWEPQKEPHEGLKQGRLEFALHGQKLTGSWVLIRIKGRERSDKNNWLLIKRTDDAARPAAEYDVVQARPESVKPGRKSRSPPHEAIGKLSGARRAWLPEFVAPQLASLRSQPPSGENWLHEVKYDGYRLLCRLERGKARLITRNDLDWTHRYSSVAKDAEQLPAASALLDGELVALLPSGVSSFQALQNATKNGAAAHLVYYAFDLLHLDGCDLRQLPLIERKRLLQAILAKSKAARVRLSEHFDADGPVVFAECCKMGLEGIISKRRDRPYRSGRSDDWVKTKCLTTEELVIGGYTISDKKAREFGALLAGYYDKGRLIYAGRIGTGFDVRTLKELRRRLAALEIDKSPFADVPDKERGANVRWVRPKLVAQLKFTGWTDTGILRHPSFQGLREDKPAAEVTRPPSLQGSITMNKRQSKARARKKQADPALDQSMIAAKLTNPQRILYPDSQITKLQLAEYYAEISQHILPHLADRPLSLVRCPAGVSARCFYQRHAAAGTPNALRRIDIQEKEEVEQYLIADDVDGLLALAQMSILEIHPWGSRGDRLDHPDRLFFDLDPDESVPWQRMIDAAALIRQFLKAKGLTSFVKTTGGKGLHVVAPLSPRRAQWPEVKQFARETAQWFAEQSPQLFTAVMSKAARRGKIFIDYLRNDRGATAVAPFSTRAKAGATVSMPLAWEELSAGMRSDHFNVHSVRDRLASQRTDPWKGFFDLKQTIPAL